MNSTVKCREKIELTKSHMTACMNVWGKLEGVGGGGGERDQKLQIEKLVDALLRLSN